MKTIISIVILIFQIFFTHTIFAQNIGSKELSELKKEYNSFIQNNSEIICWDDVKILFTMEYEGSQSPASMLFLSNSIMVLKSNFFNLDFQIENRFFAYTLNGDILKIILIDTRLDASLILNIAMNHLNLNVGIISVDEAEKSITYDLSRNGILIGGTFFFLD